MKPDDDIFAEALELPAAERAAFLDRACAGEAAQLARLGALLAAHDAAQGFLEQPVTARPPAVPEETPGTVIGPYTLRQRLGEGGCGVVWLADQSAPLARTVALKVIKPGMDTRSVIARFAAERQVLALMNHPDIARVYDAGTTAAGRPYFVMEYVEGIPITRFCDEHNLPMPRRLALFRRVCLALSHAHQKGVIHRDLKPSNILVALRDGEPAPKVIDFGIAKATAGGLSGATAHTELGLFLGTPAYMSPEQAELRDADIDTRSDVYALGVLLYELLTGRPPYDPRELVRAGVLEIRRIIREVDPPRPSARLATLAGPDRDTVARQRGATPPRLTSTLRGDLDWIVMRCLEKDRERRYDTAAALADDVRRHLDSEPVVARPPHAAYRLRKFVARNRLACASAALVALALVGGTVVSTLQAVRARRAEAAANLARTDAQRRQDQAEALLTFMLGDFRSELQKIGRLDLLDRISAQAMEYFEALDLRDVTDTALARQAKALTQLGEVRLEQARYPEADAAFAAAHARAAALADRHPGSADMLFERGQAEFWRGLAARRRGDLASQRDWLVRYRDTALALSGLEGPTARAQVEVSAGHHNLAVLDVDTGNLAAARAGFLAERDILAQMLPREPEDISLRAKLADLASWLGTIAERDGRLAEAAGHYADMAAGYTELVRTDPASARWRQNSTYAQTFSGRLQLALGRPEEAGRLFAEAAARQRELVAADPANKTRLSALVSLQLHQAALLLADGDPAKAAVLLPEILTAAGSLVAQEPASLNFARLLAAAHRLDARLALAAHRPDDAKVSLARARTLLAPLLQDNRADAWVRHEAAHALILSGRLAQADGQPGDATARWQEASAILAPHLADSRDWRLLEPAAVAAHLAGRPDDARPLALRLKDSGYRAVDSRIRADLAAAELSPSP